MSTINDKWNEFAAMCDMMVNNVGAAATEDDGFVHIESMRKQLLGFNEAVKLGAA